MTIRCLLSYMLGRSLDDPELPIYLSHDSGYTYGGVREGLFEVQEVEE